MWHRADQVQRQYGFGLKQEQPRDQMDISAINNAREELLRIDDRYSPALRVVVPFIVSTNFRGTNCPAYHLITAGRVRSIAA